MATVCSTVGNTVGNTTGDTVGTAIGENNRFSICSDPLLDCLCRKKMDAASDKPTKVSDGHPK